MESAGIPAGKPGGRGGDRGRLESRTFRLILLRRIRLRREGSLAAALTQSMALAVMGTAGAYPSWVLVRDQSDAIVLGAAWAITREDPAPDAPLLGPAGAPLMLAIACCCLLSVLSGSAALTLDFLGRRRCRSAAPLLHGLTAALMACAAALGSCLLALVRGRVHTEPELRPRRLATGPGQSLFLAVLACALASTATGLSCTSPALVQPARSSWDFRGHKGAGFFPHPAAAAARATGGDSADSSRASAKGSSDSLRATASSQDTFASAEISSPESGHSARVHWGDQKGQSAPEKRSWRKGQQPEEEQGPDQPQEPARVLVGKSSLERYWESSWVLLRSIESFFQPREIEPAEPQARESESPAKNQESETGQEAGCSRSPDC